MLKIYGRANSINVRKVLWACGEIGIPFIREDWGRGYRPTTEPAFQRLSTFGVVPVVDDDGFVLRESNTIVRYLCAKHGRADLYPAELKARASVEAWMDWASTDLYSHVRPVFMGLVVKNPAFMEPKALAASIDEWTKGMHLLDQTLAAAGPHLMGVPFTIADIPAGLIVNRWYATAFEKPEFANVARYYDKLSERPAYREHGRNGTP